MPIGDAVINAMCDKCGEESDLMNLMPLAGGGWDARNIPGKLRGWGWTVKEKITVCDECTNAEREPKRKSK